MPSSNTLNFAPIPMSDQPLARWLWLFPACCQIRNPSPPKRNSQRCPETQAKLRGAQRQISLVQAVLTRSIESVAALHLPNSYREYRSRQSKAGPVGAKGLVCSGLGLRVFRTAGGFARYRRFRSGRKRSLTNQACAYPDRGVQRRMALRHECLLLSGGFIAYKAINYSRRAYRLSRTLLRRNSASDRIPRIFLWCKVARQGGE